MSILLKLENVKAYYRQILRTVRAVDGVDLTVFTDEVLGIVGESGCGKSTMANVMMFNIRRPLEYIGGSITLYSDKIVYNLEKMNRDELRRYVWGKEIAIVPQSAMNALMPTLRIRNIVLDVMKSHYGEVDEKSVVEMAMKRFEDLGLPPNAILRYPFELSGGMRQRAVLAISTLLNPKLLIADEPTSALDVVTQKVVLKTMYDLKRRGIIKSIVFISHDIATVRQIATRIAVMYAGKIVEINSMEDTIREPLHPYTRVLIESVATPEPEVRKRGLRYIVGQPPDLSNPPPGCRFHPRCPFAMDICRKEEPPMIDMGNGKQVACWLYAKR